MTGGRVLYDLRPPAASNRTPFAFKVSGVCKQEIYQENYIGINTFKYSINILPTSKEHDPIYLTTRRFKRSIEVINEDEGDFIDWHPSLEHNKHIWLIN